MKKVLIYLTSVFIVLVIISALYGNYYIHKSIEKSAPIKISIPKGSSINAIVEILNNNELAQPAWFYKLYIKYLSIVEKRFVQAGVYLFPQNITSFDLVEALFKAEYLYIARVTFPEGISYREFASILKREALIDSSDFVNYAESDSLLKKRNIPGSSIEGYLLPETYEFYMESSAKDVLDKLLNAHSKMFERIKSQSKNIQKLNKHEILTLASIVEAETSDEDERKKVAGLYVNRLNLNMLLQADPTVAYSIGENKRILYKFLQSNNPYNTYKHKGLPPGPINNPGSKSIAASMNPEKHDFLYMVSTGDGTGRHNFAKTFAEHKQYVSEYRKKIK